MLPFLKKGINGHLIVVESTLAFVPAFLPLCTVLMIKTRFFACGIRSLLTRELVYGSLQGIATLLAWRTSSSLSILAFGLMLIGVVHVLRLPASGPMYIVFRLLPLMVVWVLLFWFCLAFFGFACLAACACTFTSCLLHWRLRSPCRARLQKKKKFCWETLAGGLSPWVTGWRNSCFWLFLFLSVAWKTFLRLVSFSNYDDFGAAVGWLGKRTRSKLIYMLF